MKKIGIITDFYKSYNYGGVLQAYALPKVCEKMGFSCEQIAFDKKGNENEVSVKGKIKNIKKIGLKEYLNLKVHYTLKSQVYAALEIRKELFKKFIDKHIIYSNIYNQATIKNAGNKYDAFICGSDQIWNPKWYCKEYFLNFVPNEKLKIAYSASIGRDKLSRDEELYIKPLIKRLNFISVRENNAKELIKGITDKDLFVTLDPTLLLNKSEWDKVQISPYINKPYIFVYLLGENDANKKYIKKIATDLNMKVIYIPYTKLRYNKHDDKLNTININDVGPAEFVGLIKNAEIIITDSFHGCVFSIIYQKKFWCLKRNIDTEKESMNSRIYTLFENLEIGNRFIDKNNIHIKNKFFSEIEYEGVNKNLNELKRNSLNFLKNALSSLT